MSSLFAISNISDANTSSASSLTDVLESRCFYVNSKLALCGPIDPSLTIATGLEKREDMSLTCYPILRIGDSAHMFEVCSTSKQEAHLQIVKEYKQMAYIGGQWN